MKKKDLGPLLLVAGISALLSFFISGAIISPSDSTETTEVVGELSSEFIKPTNVYYNGNSNNPAKKVSPGQEDTANPFLN